MEKSDNQKGILQSLDWWTIGIYLALLAFGWVSVCGASYTYGDTEIFSLSTRSGMQIVWIGTSICLGFVILMLDDRYFDTFNHLENAKNNGVTAKEIAAVITHVAFYAGWPKAWAVFNMAKEVWKED